MRVLIATDTGRAPRRPAKPEPPTAIPGREAADLEPLSHPEFSRLAIEIDSGRFPAETVVDAPFIASLRLTLPPLAAVILAPIGR